MGLTKVNEQKKEMYDNPKYTQTDANKHNLSSIVELR